MVRDGSSYQPFGIQSDVTLDNVSANIEGGVAVAAVQSKRFFLPALPSIGGFPFDDLYIRPIVDVSRNGNYTPHFRLDVQKALPGRILEVTGDNIPEIRLTRSPTEKAIVITSSLIFLFLSGILAYSLLAMGQGLSILQDLLAVGGYLVAAAGFREILGVSRSSGATALEVVVIGIPLLLLMIVVGLTFIRGLSFRRNKRS